VFRSVVDPAKSAAGRLGAFALYATHDPKVTSQRGRDTFMQRFEREVDPLGQLDPAERARRAEFAKKLYFGRLALKSAKVRRARKQGQS
jgi:hypothetical protein